MRHLTFYPRKISLYMSLKHKIQSNLFKLYIDLLNLQNDFNFSKSFHFAFPIKKTLKEYFSKISNSTIRETPYTINSFSMLS